MVKPRVTFAGCAIEDRGTYLIARGLLSAAQLKKSDRYFNSKKVQKQVEQALVHDSAQTAYKFRKSKIAFLDVHERPWLFKRLSGVSKASDAKFKTLRYRASDGVVQPKYDELQYTEYHGSEGGHFGTWHTDAEDGGDDREDSRELSVVLMLSARSKYTGGLLQVKRGGRSGKRGESQIPPPKSMVEDVDLEAGDAAIFPAKKVWHRVTKTRSGLRRTVVFWVS